MWLVIILKQVNFKKIFFTVIIIDFLVRFGTTINVLYKKPKNVFGMGSGRNIPRFSQVTIIVLQKKILSISHFSISQFTFFLCNKWIKNPTTQYFTHMPLNLRQDVKKSLIGGLSNVFCRKMEPGQQLRLLQPELIAEFAQFILGLDANNLYVS